MAKKQPLKPIQMLTVNQWLPDWDKVDFDPKQHRRKPEPNFYVFSMSAVALKALAGISRRTTKEGLKRDQDLGVQRRHDEKRSAEIREYVRFGFPWSDLSESKRKLKEFDDLRKPGWLPTAIVLNILRPEDQRREQKVHKDDLLRLEKVSTTNSCLLHLPQGFNSQRWRPKAQHPIEIIDGQHRLWAFEEELKEGDIELPVVAFYGLDISWQAYLFYTINIKPKRINASLAYDLYPLLRTETWLDRFSGHPVYRESRAQEITSSLWGFPDSAWFQKINMLGEPGQQTVTQAAWIRSLLVSYVKSWDGRRGIPGGLFGSPVGEHKTVLPWSGAQQAAFLIHIWKSLEIAIKGGTSKWIKQLRAEKTGKEVKGDPAFWGSHSLLKTDQGVRGVLYVTNDLIYSLADDLHLFSWKVDISGGATDFEAVADSLKSLKKHSVSEYIDGLVKELAKFDWRTSTAEGLTSAEREEKLVYRGSGGYKELRRRLLQHLLAAPKFISSKSEELLANMGHENAS